MMRLPFVVSRPGLLSKMRLINKAGTAARSMTALYHTSAVTHVERRTLLTALQAVFLVNTRVSSRRFSTRAVNHQPKAHYHTTIDADVARTETPQFQKKVRAELNQAKQFILNRIAQKEKGFVVLDIDETVLDNRDFYRDPHKIFYKAGQGGFYEQWDRWVAQMKAPVLPAAKQFIDWLNENNIPYRFVTGRIEKQREATMKNLEAANLIGKSFQGLHCKPDGGRANSTKAYKKRVLPEIEKETNMKAIASIGDRDGDLMLAEPERNFKLSSSEFYPPRDKDRVDKE